MAKSILHALVGVLVGEGRLDLHRPRPGPGGRPPTTPASSITLDHLLHMRSGLQWLEDYVDGERSNVIEMLFGPGRPDVAGYAAGLPLAHPVDSTFCYSSGTSCIVSAATRQRRRRSRRLRGVHAPGAVRPDRHALAHPEVRRQRHVDRLVLLLLDRGGLRPLRPAWALTGSTICRCGPNRLDTHRPCQGLDGNGAVTDNTGQGVMRVTLSVMLPLRIRLNPRWRRGDMMIRSALKSSAACVIAPRTGPKTTRLLTQRTCLIAAM